MEKNIISFQILNVLSYLSKKKLGKCVQLYCRVGKHQVDQCQIITNYYKPYL